MSSVFKCARYDCPCWQLYEEANRDGFGSYCSMRCASLSGVDKQSVYFLAPVKASRFFAKEFPPMRERQMGAEEDIELFQVVG